MTLSANNEQMEFLTIILENTLIFPKTDLLIELSHSMRGVIEEIQKHDLKNLNIILTAKKETIVKKSILSIDEVYNVGVVCKIAELKPSAKGYQLKVQATSFRFKIETLKSTSQHVHISTGSYLMSDLAGEQINFDLQYQMKNLLEVCKELIMDFDQIQPLFFMNELISICDMTLGLPELTSYLLASHFPFSLSEKFELLQSKSSIERVQKIIELMSLKITKFNTDKDYQNNALKKMQKTQREYVLREQLNEIKKELGEGDSDKTDAFSKKLKECKFPLDIKKIVDEEYSRMTQLNPASQDYHVIKNYLEWMMSIPFNKTTKDNLDIIKAKEILNEDHYGLEQVKKRILEFLSISKLKGSFRGQVLCLAGPPGVGKTSLVKSIAKSIGRKYVRMSLGGVHDEAEIRGHRKTYVGAMPGRIIQNLKKAGSMNPIILLDEIDKLGKSNHGDPSSALLEVLDPEQNHSFNDHFMNANIDLSNVFFIATANNLSEIPAPLRDRMEIIQLGSYTHTEKKHIAVNHLIKKQLQEFCLEKQNFTFDEAAVNKIINEYTREAGVRDLQRKIGQICRYIAQEVVEGTLKSTIITVDKIQEVLGKETVHHENALDYGEVGVVSGLAWTSVGGEMLFIESNFMPGNGKMMLTGSLGNVMKESANIALSYIKSNVKELGLTEFDFDKHDIHLHFPSGATPKDGPSAGIAICTCLVSLLTNQKIDNHLAMTGEISLRGKVLPVGGIKEKVIAAHRAGIKTVILPEDNRVNEEEIPQEVKDGLTIIYVNKFSEVIIKSIK